MNASGFRVCVKELFGTRYDPLSVSYALLTGSQILKICSKLIVISNDKHTKSRIFVGSVHMCTFNLPFSR